MWHKALSVLVLVHCCMCVVVKDGDFEFSLESVKKLKELMDVPDTAHQRSQRDAPNLDDVKLCANPKLPEEFKPVCARANAAEIFTRLERIAKNPDLCDVCAFAACTGC